MAKKVSVARGASRQPGHGRTDPRQRVHPASPSRVAAPGKRHQPTKESGKGTPSADARPGASGFTGPLDEEEQELLQRHRERQGKRVKVQAIRLGYYDNKRRRPGDVFFINGEKHEADVKDIDEHTGRETGKVLHRKGDIKELGSWMRLVPMKTPLSSTGAQQAVNDRHDEILSGKIGEKLAREGSNSDPNFETEVDDDSGVDEAPRKGEDTEDDPLGAGR